MPSQSEFMQEAIRLARNGIGHTSPNPMVGALIVKDGRVIGAGYHPEYGQKHAEVVAIENAVEAVAGAEMYCSLEPCCHRTPGKKNPPCTDRLIEERIRKVYLPTLDPNPHVSGKGIEMLRRAGIEVELGIGSDRAAFLNEAYFKFIQTGNPLIHLKMALTIDGRIAARSGDSKWITDEDARRFVHQMRMEHDAVLVGVNTVIHDNPQLTVRMINGPQPKRIVVDSRLSIPPGARLLTDEFRQYTIIFTTPGHSPAKRKKLEAQGVRVLVTEADCSGRVSLRHMLKILGKMKIISLMVEGGSAVFTDFINQRLFDKVSVFTAPLLLGSGIDAVGDLGHLKISEAIRLSRITYKQINDQIVLQGYRDLQDTFGLLKESVECLQES